MHARLKDGLFPPAADIRLDRRNGDAGQDGIVIVNAKVNIRPDRSDVQLQIDRLLPAPAQDELRAVRFSVIHAIIAARQRDGLLRRHRGRGKRRGRCRITAERAPGDQRHIVAHNDCAARAGEHGQRPEQCAVRVAGQRHILVPRRVSERRFRRCAVPRARVADVDDRRTVTARIVEIRILHDRLAEAELRRQCIVIVPRRKVQQRRAVAQLRQICPQRVRIRHRSQNFIPLRIGDDRAELENVIVRAHLPAHQCVKARLRRDLHAVRLKSWRFGALAAECLHGQRDKAGLIELGEAVAVLVPVRFVRAPVMDRGVELQHRHGAHLRDQRPVAVPLQNRLARHKHDVLACVGKQDEYAVARTQHRVAVIDKLLIICGEDALFCGAGARVAAAIVAAERHNAEGAALLAGVKDEPFHLQITQSARPRIRQPDLPAAVAAGHLVPGRRTGVDAVFVQHRGKLLYILIARDRIRGIRQTAVRHARLIIEVRRPAHRFGKVNILRAGPFDLRKRPCPLDHLRAQLIAHGRRLHVRCLRACARCEKRRRQAGCRQNA